MSEDMEAKVWEKRMPDLAPAEQLAVEIDRFSHDYDVYSYRNNNQNMTESVSEISEMIVQGNTEPITDWLSEVISEGDVLDATFFNKTHAELFPFVGRNTALFMLL